MHLKIQKLYDQENYLAYLKTIDISYKFVEQFNINFSPHEASTAFIFENEKNVKTTIIEPLFNDAKLYHNLDIRERKLLIDRIREVAKMYFSRDSSIAVYLNLYTLELFIDAERIDCFYCSTKNPRYFLNKEIEDVDFDAFDKFVDFNQHPGLECIPVVIWEQEINIPHDFFFVNNLNEFGLCSETEIEERFGPLHPIVTLNDIETKAKLWDAFQADLAEWMESDYSTVDIGTMVIDFYSK